MVVKPEQDRVRTLLTDTVTLLCKNGLTFSKEMKVQGTLGITLDENDVLLIHINEVFAEVAKEIPTIDFPASLMLDNNSESTSSKKRRKRRGSRDSESGSATPSKRNRDTNSHESHEVRVKEEKQEDVICLEDNDEADIKPHPLREASFSSFAQMDQNNQQYSSGMLQQSQNSVPSQMSDNSNASWDGSSSSQLPHMTPYKGVPGMQGGTPGSGEPWNAADPNFMLGGGYKQYRPRNAGDVVCEVPGCNKTFHYRHSMTRHMRMNHGIIEPPMMTTKDAGNEGDARMSQTIESVKYAQMNQGIESVKYAKMNPGKEPSNDAPINQRIESSHNARMNHAIEPTKDSRMSPGQESRRLGYAGPRVESGRNTKTGSGDVRINLRDVSAIEESDEDIMEQIWS